MIRLPLGIDRVSRVQESDDGGTIKVRVEIMPPQAQLPESLGKPASYTVTLDDTERTAMRVRSVTPIANGPAVVLEIEPPPSVTSGRFTIHIEGLVPGLDATGAAWGLRHATVDPSVMRPPSAPASTAPSAPHYLYRDYASFKQVMIDVVQRAMPRLREVHEADTGIAIIDILAYAADHLAYYQDAVATEAYLTTARRRVSIRRHARLLDYRLFEGCTPRVWIHVCPADVMTFGKHHRFTAASASDVPEEAQIFETLAETTVYPTQCDMMLWNFEGAETVLPAGRTTAVLDTRQGAVLRAGDVLVFEQDFDPTSGQATSPQHRQAVRLRKDGRVYVHPSRPGRSLVQITWQAEDALVLPYDLRTRASDGKPATHVHGNMVLADFGASVDDDSWYELDRHGVLRAFIPDLTYAVTYEPGTSGITAQTQQMRAYNALPQITATSYSYGIERAWTARYDLIGANPFECAFVVEIERNGGVMLRFGDGKSGAKPLPHTRFRLAYRRGYGPSGLIGPDAIATHGTLQGVAYRARNPLASFGSAARQDADEARRAAPERVHNARPKRCIADEDFVRCARDVEGVRAAAVRRRWTGSGTTVQVYVDGELASDVLCQRVREALETSRVICTDINVLGPRYVGLLAKLAIVIAPGASENDVKRRVSAAVAAALEAERLTLGSTVYASWFVAAAMRTTGVLEAELREFRRATGTDQRAAGVLHFDQIEKPSIVDERGIATGGRPLVEVRR